jgi:hypothetical protein
MTIEQLVGAEEIAKTRFRATPQVRERFARECREGRDKRD